MWFCVAQIWRRLLQLPVIMLTFLWRRAEPYCLLLERQAFLAGFGAPVEHCGSIHSLCGSGPSLFGKVCVISIFHYNVIQHCFTCQLPAVFSNCVQHIMIDWKNIYIFYRKMKYIYYRNERVNVQLGSSICMQWVYGGNTGMGTLFLVPAVTWLRGCLEVNRFSLLCIYVQFLKPG